MPDKTIRAFIALPLAHPLRERIDILQRRLAPQVPPRSVRWVPPRNIHVTLFFIGDVLPQRLSAVHTALEAVANAVHPVSFRVQGLGTFPNLKRPRIVWIGIENAEHLRLLHRAVNEAMDSVGFMPEMRPFSPHLTIARVGRRVKAETARELGKVVRLPKHDPGILGDMTAREVILYRSTLKSSGAEYDILGKFQLGE